MKPFLTIMTGLLVAGPLLHARETRLLDGNLLLSLRAEAARNHPAAKSAQLTATAAAGDARVVRLWDDPMVGLSVMAASKDMRRDEGDLRVSFEQPLPKPGLFAANRAKADALQRAGQENSRSTSLETGAAAVRDAIELALADESVALQAAQVTWIESMVTNARQMAVNPDATGLETLRLESELARETQILHAARRTRESLSQSLNLRLGRSLESPWPVLQLPSAPLPVPVASAEIARILQVNPKVRSMREMASAANAETRIADRDRAPQFALSVDTDIYSGGDIRSASVGLKMSLPYFNRASYDAKTEASRLREKAAVKDIESTRLEIASAVLAATTAASNAAAQARAYSGEIHQRALQASQAVEASWISSKSPLTDLLEANRQLFSIRLEQRRFIALQLAALEELNLLVPVRP
ncbi:MAG: TolC family protein [Verrucomicrobiaceae bacterium]|nr:MAG: TolC family protein [Verrucomicrobiaceae bacterium]